MFLSRWFLHLHVTGTIAEREHRKWESAPPLPNNPYSTENINKRLSRQSVGFSNHSSSISSSTTTYMWVLICCAIISQSSRLWGITEPQLQPSDALKGKLYMSQDLVYVPVVYVTVSRWFWWNSGITDVITQEEVFMNRFKVLWG
jgi:hypothetical protein